MAKQTINVGTVADDGTGDPLRTAFVKTNQNFTELYDRPEFSGEYSDLANTPAFANVATSGEYSDLANTPMLANVAITGSYLDLSNTTPIASDPYRGFYVGVNKIYGSDPSINQLIIVDTTEIPQPGNAELPYFDEPSAYETFFMDKVKTANTVVMLNVYGKYKAYGLENEDLELFAKRFIDNVLYNGVTRVTSASTANTRFYSNYSTVVGTLSTDLYENFVFYLREEQSEYEEYRLDVVTGGSGTGFVPTIYRNFAGQYIDVVARNAGTNYEENDVIEVSGTLLYGVEPTHNATITVLSVGGEGDITSLSISGNSARSGTMWPYQSISDGSGDQYDTGNFIKTDHLINSPQQQNNNFNNGDPGVPYGYGLVVSGASSNTYWNPGGSSEYVTAYQNSVWTMMTFGADVKLVRYSGNLGADGRGGQESEYLIGGYLSENVEPFIDRLTKGALQLLLTSDGKIRYQYTDNEEDDDNERTILLGSEGGVTIGRKSVEYSQAFESVSVGNYAGDENQGESAIAIGASAGTLGQNTYAIAIGAAAAATGQGEYSIAVGTNAGYEYQGNGAIAIGQSAGYSSQNNNSIVINATGTELNSPNANTFTVKPVRGDSTANLTSAGFKQVYYNPTTGEFAYTTS
jgi:hypothetical protein